MRQATLSQKEAPANDGVSINIDQLRQLRREVLTLSAEPADVVSSLFPGAYRARFRGRGIEFDETRNYQWGDDYRTLDWRVTARTGEMHTKLFHEERERTLYLVLDQGERMKFGTRVQFKWVLAARIAALFAWLAVECGDRVGCVIYGSMPRIRIVPPGNGESGVMRIFRHMTEPAEMEEGGRCGINDALFYLRRHISPGAMILLLSDFSHLDHQAKRHIASLSRYSTLAAVGVFDCLESELPAAGIYPITDGRDRSLLDTRSPASREAYRNEFDKRQAQLKRLFQRYNARYLSMATDEVLVERLRYMLLQTAGKGRRFSGRR